MGMDASYNSRTLGMKDLPTGSVNKLNMGKRDQRERSKTSDITESLRKIDDSSLSTAIKSTCKKALMILVKKDNYFKNTNDSDTFIKKLDAAINELSENVEVALIFKEKMLGDLRLVNDTQKCVMNSKRNSEEFMNKILE
jgi:hypothetical protein